MPAIAAARVMANGSKRRTARERDRRTCAFSGSLVQGGEITPTKNKINIETPILPWEKKYRNRRVVLVTVKTSRWSLPRWNIDPLSHVEAISEGTPLARRVET